MYFYSGRENSNYKEMENKISKFKIVKFLGKIDSKMSELDYTPMVKKESNFAGKWRY